MNSLNNIPQAPVAQNEASQSCFGRKSLFMASTVVSAIVGQAINNQIISVTAKNVLERAIANDPTYVLKVTVALAAVIEALLLFSYGIYSCCKKKDMSVVEELNVVAAQDQALIEVNARDVEAFQNFDDDSGETDSREYNSTSNEEANVIYTMETLPEELQGNRIALKVLNHPLNTLSAETLGRSEAILEQKYTQLYDAKSDLIFEILSHESNTFGKAALEKMSERMLQQIFEDLYDTTYTNDLIPHGKSINTLSKEAMAMTTDYPVDTFDFDSDEDDSYDYEEGHAATVESEREQAFAKIKANELKKQQDDLSDFADLDALMASLEDKK